MNWSEIIQIALVALCPIMMIFCYGRMIFGGKGGSCGSDEPKEGEQRTQTLRKERSEQEVKWPIPAGVRPQAKMTNECAQLLLSAYRPNGAEAQDPVFKEALEEVQRDPVLASWFREQRDFDDIISAKLRSIEPPAGLEMAILAGLRTTSIRRSPFIQWLAIAAVLILGLIVLSPLGLKGPPKQDRFMAFYEY